MTILDLEQLAQVLESGEGRQLEFKEGLAADGRVARTICAFANTRGGILLVGVSDRGEVRGVPRPGKVTEGLKLLAAGAVEPPVDVRVEVLQTASGVVVCCSVPLSPARPHAVKPGTRGWSAEILVRSGASNRAATGKALESVGPEARDRSSPTPLEEKILGTLTASRGATVEGFAQSHGVGKQKARQAFESLERAGLLIAHGLGERRVYELP